MGAEGVKALSDSLKANATLTSLDLESAFWPGEPPHGAYVGLTFAHASALLYLCVFSPPLGIALDPAACSQLASLLQVNAGLRTIGLKSTPVGTLPYTALSTKRVHLGRHLAGSPSGSNTDSGLGPPPADCKIGREGAAEILQVVIGEFQSLVAGIDDPFASGVCYA